MRAGTRTYRLRCAFLESGAALIEHEGCSHLAHVATAGTHTYLHLDGVTVDVETARAGDGRAPRTAAVSNELRAPMPGVVARVLVRAGETVRTGQPLLVVEAMKIEHVVRAAGPGVVRVVCVAAGDRVEGGVIVAELDPVSFGEAP
ncbi:MAG TPA: acetyl-CoA carboxylase biotin carboxyl carrier protein subunit [bacterium]|nr:acetyl-CoA carboxylase biotin carboxyl carrier protein subunit [bacterium]